MKSILIRLCLVFLICQVTIDDISAQVYNPFNQRDDQYRLLGLKRSKEAFETARAEYDRQVTLFEKGLITKAELDRARSIFSDAEVNYQQSLLAVLFEKQYISVTAAVKYQSPDGQKHVKLTLANTSGGTEEFRKLINIDDQLFNSLQPDIIHNVYISLMNNNNAIISQPYETKITDLHYGTPQTVDFTLLEDVDAATVFIIYGNGSQRTMKIFLQKDASVNKVTIQSEQFSQEVELGSKANFDLTLELYSGINNIYTMEALNLPRQVSRHFKDATGQVRLRQVKFTESNRAKNAILQITLPDRSDDQTVVMDEPIPFFVVALPDNKLQNVTAAPDKIWTEEELISMEVGYVRLELIPKGKGILLVRAPQLYHSVQADETVEMYIDLINEGSRRLDQLEIKADLPLEWSKQITPENIGSLDIGAEARIKFQFTPPPEISVGKYEVRILTTALTSGQLVTGSEKIVTIEIRAEANIAGTALVVIFIVAIVGGIIFYGIRLSKR